MKVSKIIFLNRNMISGDKITHRPFCTTTELTQLWTTVNQDLLSSRGRTKVFQNSLMKSTDVMLVYVLLSSFMTEYVKKIKTLSPRRSGCVQVSTETNTRSLSIISITWKATCRKEKKITKKIKREQRMKCD